MMSRRTMIGLFGLGLVGCSSADGPPSHGAAVVSDAGPTDDMDPATYAANAMSEGINALYAILDWNDKGATGAPPMTSAEVARVMGWLDKGLDEVLHGGRVWSGGPPLTDADLVRVRRVQALLPTWPSKGPLPAELVTVAEDTFRAILGGQNWRELRAAAESRKSPDPSR